MLKLCDMQILLPRGKPSSYMSLRLVGVQHHPGLGRQHGSYTDQPFRYILVHR